MTPGKLVGAVNVLIDITDLKKQEEAERRLAAIVEWSEDAIIGKNLDSIITSWNKSAERIFGYQAGEVIGKPVTILMPPERFNEEQGIIERLRRGETISHYETVRRRKDGTLIDISLSVSPVRDGTGNIIGASKIARDITHHKHIEAELKRAHDRAQKANHAKDVFLAALSHELRTPLSPVLLLASDAANNRELPPRVRTDFDTICKNIELEAQLIDDLLDLSCMTFGKMTVDMKILDPHEPLLAALGKVQNDVSQKRIDLTLNLNDETFFVKGDVARLQQIFWNILKNAVKFTPANGNITVTSLADAKNEKMVVVISDSGIGMSATESNHAFEAFSQGDQSAVRKQFGGLGFGLAISHRLVDLHSGEIHAASDGPGKGSTFTITLPLAKNAGRSSKTFGDASTSVKSQKRGLRILLVEDHEPTNRSLTQLLLRRCHKITAAASLGEARAAVKKEKFDLLISDIGLPDGTGFELMKELKDKYGLKGIALTGYGTEQDIIFSQKSGFMTHLTKPVRMESLEAALVAASESVKSV